MAARDEILNKSIDQLLVDDLDSDSSHHNDDAYENPATEIGGLETTVDVHIKNNETSNFILNKFLQDSMQLHNEKTNLSSAEKVSTSDSPIVRAPIPLPRKHKPKLSVKSSSSNHTYNVENSNVLGADNAVLSDKTKDSDECDIVVPETGEAENATSKCSVSSKEDLSHADDLKEAAEEVGKDDDDSKKWSYAQLIGVKIHKTNLLLSAFSEFVCTPTVQVHVVCKDTGEYIIKSNPLRPTTCDQEDVGHKFILPIMTRYCRPDDNNPSHMTRWEELIVVNEDIDYILDSTTNTMLFFELIDFTPFPLPKHEYRNYAIPRGWIKIAWAFLVLRNETNTRLKSPIFNTERRMRLHLYEVPETSYFKSKFSKRPTAAASRCPIYEWWKKGKRQKLPAYLQVSVFGIKSKESTPSEEELAGNPRNAKRQNMTHDNSALALNIDKPKPAIRSFKIPNKTIAELNSDAEGCFFLTFNHSGTKLVCSTAGAERFSIVGFDVTSLPEAKEIFRNAVHQGLIHLLSWSSDDGYLLSASSDCTVCLWKYEEDDMNLNLIQMIPHPTFVYCAIFNGISDETGGEKLLIVSGSYDRTIRVWESAPEANNYHIAEELEGHSGFVTCLCFNASGSHLYSGDSEGRLKEWTCSTSATEKWAFKRAFEFRDMEGIVVNHLAFHPKKERRLLVHSRDSVIRIVDVRLGFVIQWIRGHLNQRFQAFSCFSPCGNYVYSGGDDSKVCVWSSETGNSKGILEPFAKFGKNVSSNCVAHHPKDHVLAVSQYGKRFPVVLMGCL